MKKINIVIGNKYGKWKVLGKEIKVGLHWKILCVCDCSIKRFVRISRLVKYGSLGCRKCGSGNLKHSHKRNYKGSSEYNSWNNMKIRCYCESSKDYENYGGRGIKVCSEWLDSFETFLFDMGTKTTKFHSLDREDNNGNYEPDNG